MKKYKSSFMLNECDFMFFLRYDEIIKRNIDNCFFMLGIYLSYNLFLEIKALASFILENKNPNKEQEIILKEILNVF